MKITDENVIKNGQKELLETIIGGLDLNVIKKTFSNKLTTVTFFRIKPTIVLLITGAMMFSNR